MTNPPCLHCTSSGTHKAGRNASGSQRYYCTACIHYFTPSPRLNGYAPEFRAVAIRAVLQGNNFSGAAHLLQVAPQSVANWAGAHAATLPPADQPSDPDIVEVDELFTFIGNKDTRVYLTTLVDRESRCFWGWDVLAERTAPALQALVDASPRAFQYNTDDFSVYHALNWRGQYHLVAPGKSQTFAVEANNAELRHYLARLARRTRCYSKKLAWLKLMTRLFVYYWNKRQLYQRQYPHYRQTLVSFVPNRI